MSGGLPPIHEVPRFWHPTNAATLKSCAAFLGKKPPFWNLHWLREWAPRIISRELTPPMLRQAVKANVPDDARPSVNRAVDLFFKSVERHQWRGEPLSEVSHLCKSSYTTVKPIGIYHSKKLDAKFVLALQPRSQDIPDLEQMRIWYSALHYKFAAERDASVMIIDLSKNPITERRELRELGPDKLQLLELEELKRRLIHVEEQFFDASKFAVASNGAPKPSKRQGKLKF